MAALSGVRFYAPDLRGYGESDRPQRGYDVFTLTDDIKALMEVLAIDKPVLVSHDWGGALGWIFAHRYSDHIRKLAVVNCTHPGTLVQNWEPTFAVVWRTTFGHHTVSLCPQLLLRAA